MTDLESLKQKALKASLGPWHIGHVSESYSDPSRIGELADIDDAEGCIVAEVHWRRDQSFICAANPQVVLSLIERIQEQEEELNIVQVMNNSNAQDCERYRLELSQEKERSKGLVEALKSIKASLDGGFYTDGIVRKSLAKYSDPVSAGEMNDKQETD